MQYYYSYISSYIIVINFLAIKLAIDVPTNIKNNAHKILFATFFGEVVFRNDHFLGRIKINDSNYHISVMRKTDELLKETIIFKTFFNENQKNSIRREIVCEKLLEGSVFLEKEYEEVFGSDFLLEQCEKCYDSRDKLISDISKKKEHHVYDEYNTKEVCFEKNQSVFNKGNVSLKCDNESKLVAVPYLGDCDYDETMSYYIKDSTKDLGYKKITGEEYYKLVGDFKVRSK